MVEFAELGSSEDTVVVQRNLRETDANIESIRVLITHAKMVLAYKILFYYKII
jgi:hypothetical protein